ncbi:hypothetical protein K7X08_000443 [Anisodus acutangulus]|uniref:PAR1 protein n=1 Tax=Anisodus acutangulus TaxID=402998 RepID=A0A9Q1M4C4_9SOLA|nr:hypothetical protein K7X08_000443 [Anisodus acutangulus]
MASMKSSLSLFFTCSLFLQVALAEYKTEIICESLPNGVCAFAIASSGKRCVLEKSMIEDGEKTLLEFLLILCLRLSSHPSFAPGCYQKCPNIVDLYFNLAAGEGVYLPDLCNKQRTNPHRATIELQSSGAAEEVADAPAQSPSSF